MSSLIFFTDATQILVATDTLAVEPSGKPFLYTSKALYLPHLRTIVAGTGAGGFSGEWAVEVNNRLVVSGIRNLDQHTPGALRRRWERYRSNHAAPDSLTTTVYHFGLAEDDSSVCSFAYRSTSNFESERLPPGLARKPDCEVPEDLPLLDALPIMMRAQRANELAKDADERLYVGGDCVVMHLSSEGCRILHLFRFDEYASELDAMFRNYRSKEA